MYPVKKHGKVYCCKADTDLADGLVLLIFLVIAGKQKAPIGACPLAFTQVGANHTQVHCVTHPLQVILLQLCMSRFTKPGQWQVWKPYISYIKHQQSTLEDLKAEIHTHLQPIMRALRNFIGCVLLQGLHHEAFAGVYTTRITHTWAHALMHQFMLCRKEMNGLSLGRRNVCAFSTHTHTHTDYITYIRKDVYTFCFTESDRVTHRGQENSIS